MGLLWENEMSNENTKFLRDFANANIDSFEEWHLHMLRNAANEIENLIEERNSARWEVCELTSNGSIDSASRVAIERGWDIANEDEIINYFCDHCGDAIDSRNVVFYNALPQDIASANKGESATTCRKCCEMIDANANNQDFRSTDMG
jgi:hypothetical protein